MQIRTRTLIVGLGAALCLAGISLAQVGPRVGQYPDVIVSSVGGSGDSTGSNALGNYGSSNGVASYAIGSDSCNIGLNPAIWLSTVNQHPVIGGEVYRLFNGRFEQIGMSWLKHAFCAADSCGFGNCSNVGGWPPGLSTCTPDYQGNPPTGGTGCDWLGFGRATDTYGSGLNGGQSDLGPRSQVNAWNGVYPYSASAVSSSGTNPSSCLNKRLLVRHTDLDPANYPRYNATTAPWGAQFFGEVEYIVTDEWPTERYNNYSYRKITAATALANPPAGGCGGTLFNLDFSGPTIPLKPAIEAWKVADPTVTLVTVNAPNDGRFYIGAKTTNLGNGTWQYEYAVFNMNSDRGAGSFSIPKAASSSVVIDPASLGFHAPEYHSGEPYEMKPWTSAVAGNSISWASTPYAVNANANAIRWSTLYNFRFTANMAPKVAANSPVRIGLFKPGVQVGDADYIDVGGLPVPGDPPCPADFNGVGGVNVADIFDFLSAWFSSSPAADFNHDSQLNVQDIFAFLSAWFTGC